ncbi:30S ribosomal protein S6--L-glutamate ligase [Flavobacteriaceae bacterium]|nr:30S ribosomal protein S6--L-glutamate ligase [Flavobacteriaceae bacterium]MDA8644238.1 30S ribosomal protein S6--L-glutamate ligase [Flavobacteriaceae bacterium]MDA8877055.1 30S ribosomal protein S6--L-glutamate ligase [Flavobacteriaceae bacterium]MDA9038202.1 30S ribosomal protein S6--L-glutamate ligase [Flavobacteriaceae bacterium]MDA9851323.1 30S ribosomal protein S6--L-glutamate ligase [Flavobacteriaceae bacterium]
MDPLKQTIIGSAEWCSFETLKIPAIKARIDSGAKTSSIQATHIRRFKRGGESWVSFEVNPLQDNLSFSIQCESKIIDTRMVRSSSGISEKRFVIQVPVSIGENTFEIELTLANRDGMDFRMLLGREAMQDRFLVNPSTRYKFGDYNEDELKSMYSYLVYRKSGLNIGLLATDRTLYSNKRLMEAGIARGHEMRFYNIQQCYMRLDADTPEVRYRGGSIINDLDAIIPRIRPSMTFYGCALLRQFDSIGAFCLNSDTSISQSRDKLFSSQLFTSNKINIPITGFAKSPLDTKDLIDMVGGAPLIIKLLQSAQGKGVVSAETNKAAESVINAFKSLQANILVQEFIKEASGKDLRCFVVNGKVVASIERTAPKGEFRSNIHIGGTAKKVKITAEERKLAVKAAKILNLAVAGVDIIRSNKGPLLLEVNSSPGLEGIESATGKNIANEMIMAIEKKLKFNPVPQ